MNPIYASRRRYDIIIRTLCVGAALFGVTWLALILFTLFYNGLAGLNFQIFTQNTPPPGSTEGGLRSFDLIWSMTRGGPGFSSDVLASVIYKQYQAGFYGLATAGNVILLIVVSIIVYPMLRYFNRKEIQL